MWGKTSPQDLQKNKQKAYKESKMKKTMETVTISKKEYEELKKKANRDLELFEQLIRGLEDVKEGRVKRVF